MICLWSLCLCFALCLRLCFFRFRLSLRRCGLTLRCLCHPCLRCIGFRDARLRRFCLRRTGFRCLCLRNRRLILLGSLCLWHCFRYSLRLCRRCLRCFRLWRACLRGLRLWGLCLRGFRLRGLRLWGLCLRRFRLWGLRLWGLCLRGACLRDSLHLCLCRLALLRHYCLCLISDGRDARLLKDHGKGQQHRQIPFYPVSSAHTSFSFHSAFFCFTGIQIFCSVLINTCFQNFSHLI